MSKFDAYYFYQTLTADQRKILLNKIRARGLEAFEFERQVCRRYKPHNYLSYAITLMKQAVRHDVAEIAEEVFQEKSKEDFLKRLAELKIEYKTKLRMEEDIEAYKDEGLMMAEIYIEFVIFNYYLELHKDKKEVVVKDLKHSFVIAISMTDKILVYENLNDYDLTWAYDLEVDVRHIDEDLELKPVVEITNKQYTFFNRRTRKRDRGNC